MAADAPEIYQQRLADEQFAMEVAEVAECERVDSTQGERTDVEVVLLGEDPDVLEVKVSDPETSTESEAVEVFD